MNDVTRTIASQYGATFSMLRQCIDRADATLWQFPIGKFPYWNVIYHVLHSTDLYLSQDEGAFTPRPFHREGYELLGVPFWASDQEAIVLDQPYDAGTLGAYVDFCRAKAKQALGCETAETLAGPSGFSWLEFSRLKLHLYILRHLQHHTGQLVVALRSVKDDGFEWAFSEPLCVGLRDVS